MKDIPAHLVRILGKWHATRIDKMVMDVVEASLAAGLERIAMSDRIMKAVKELRDFLYENVYFSPAARRGTGQDGKDPPGAVRLRPRASPAIMSSPIPAADPLEIRAADFIAGMTDSYALALYEKLFFPEVWPIL